MAQINVDLSLYEWHHTGIQTVLGCPNITALSYIFGYAFDIDMWPEIAVW